MAYNQQVWLNGGKSGVDWPTTPLNYNPPYYCLYGDYYQGVGQSIDQAVCTGVPSVTPRQPDNEYVCDIGYTRKDFPNNGGGVLCILTDPAAATASKQGLQYPNICPPGSQLMASPSGNLTCQTNAGQIVTPIKPDVTYDVSPITNVPQNPSTPPLTALGQTIGTQTSNVVSSTFANLQNLYSSESPTMQSYIKYAAIALALYLIVKE